MPGHGSQLEWLTSLNGFISKKSNQNYYIKKKKKIKGVV